MAYCRKCGKEIDDEAVICPFCGVPQNNYYSQSSMVSGIEDNGNIAWGILSGFFPIIGLVLFCLWNEKKPQNAKICFKGMIIGLAVYVVSGLITFFSLI